MITKLKGIYIANEKMNITKIYVTEIALDKTDILLYTTCRRV